MVTFPCARVYVLELICVPLFETWTVALQAPLSMGFSRQGYWHALRFPPAGHLPDPGVEPRFSTPQVDSLLLSPVRG